MESVTFRPPGELNLSDNIRANWWTWKDKFNNYLIASKNEKEQERIKIAMLLNVIGEPAIDIINTFSSFSRESGTLSALYTLMDAYVEPRKNLTLTRFQFFNMSQQDDQSVEQFITEVKLKAKMCEFEKEKENISECMIRDRIICGISDKALQENILRTHLEDIKLEKVIKLCRVSSEAKQQAQSLNDQSSVNRITKNQRSSTSVNTSKQKATRKTKAYVCKQYCGETHLPRQCPAYNHCCSECGKTGHYEVKCRNRESSEQKVDAIREKKESTQVEECFVVDMIQNFNIDD